VLIREVLKNLFTNAMEATEERGRLYLSLYETQKHVIVEIMDNGVGISPEDLPHVMEPFYTTKKESGNFGLGLSFCYNVMQKHEGFIEVESVLNEGTTVTLFFPKQKNSACWRR
jgi:signal transduction histidine kinase